MTLTAIRPHKFSKEEIKTLNSFSEEYLEQCIKEGMEDVEAGRVESGEVVFKRLRAKFEKKYGKPTE